jgi:hypothetical protein
MSYGSSETPKTVVIAYYSTAVIYLIRLVGVKANGRGKYQHKASDVARRQVA